MKSLKLSLDEVLSCRDHCRSVLYMPLCLLTYLPTQHPLPNTSWHISSQYTYLQNRHFLPIRLFLLSRAKTRLLSPVTSQNDTPTSHPMDRTQEQPATTVFSNTMEAALLRDSSGGSETLDWPSG